MNMLTDEELIEKAKKLYETRTGWGDSTAWTNRDFIALSEKIQERTEVSISHVTLKRVWGKVKYDSLPYAHTLDTLVQFLGYENWRDFKLKHGNGYAQHKPGLDGGAHINGEAYPPQFLATCKNKSCWPLTVVCNYGFLINARLCLEFDAQKPKDILQTQ